MEQLREAVLTVLGEVNLQPEDDGGAHHAGDRLVLSPQSNTWSRSARRQAGRIIRLDADGDQVPSEDNVAETNLEPIMRVQLSFVAPTPPQAVEGVEGEWRGAKLILVFLGGRDRTVVEGFWKFLLSKAGLLGRSQLFLGERGGRDGRGRRGRRGGSQHT